MGQYWYSREPVKLCDDLVEDRDFLISISIHTINSHRDFSKIVDYLQQTGVSMSYTNGHSIYLLYSPSKQTPILRSNISGDIISSLSSEITRQCLIQKICDPHFVEVSITFMSYDYGKQYIFDFIEKNQYQGYMYGLPDLSKEKITNFQSK
jgi:hypothetical protein